MTKERIEAAKRIQRMTYYYTKDYAMELENKKKEKAAIKQMKENNAKSIDFVVCTADHNAEVLMGCITDCIHAVNILTDENEDIEEWMLAGITAMLDKANETHVISFDLLNSICRLLCAQYK